MEINVKQDVIKINPIYKPAVNENSSLSDIFQIDVKGVCEANADMSYI